MSLKLIRSCAVAVECEHRFVRLVPQRYDYIVIRYWKITLMPSSLNLNPLRCSHFRKLKDVGKEEIMRLKGFLTTYESRIIL
ncbi:MAG: hypothetical protein LUQ65_00030 [Candidatus Helarchaeota archaeon]|nr:hypothetical protein [Candidatus Helarchaeota archaeon]